MNPELAPSRPICVLSVGRSGSSLATRALNLLGVYLGAEDDLLPANSGNELGFWENLAILGLNEELLELFGGSWYEPPALTAGWERDPRLSELRERAARVVAGLAGAGEPRWGFKDPRTVVLFAFWRDVVGEMDYVICVRRPRGVISSVENLGAWPDEPAATARLWLDVNALALAETTGARRTFVFYEDWFEDPRGVTDRLAAFVAGCTTHADARVHGSLARFVRSDLRRADTHEQPSADIAPELDAMYEHLRLVAACESPGPSVGEAQARVAEALAESFRARRTLHEALHGAREETLQSSAEAERMRARAADLERERRSLRHELALSRQWLAAIQGSASWRITAPLRAAKQRVALRDTSRR